MFWCREKIYIDQANKKKEWHSPLCRSFLRKNLQSVIVIVAMMRVCVLSRARGAEFLQKVLLCHAWQGWWGGNSDKNLGCDSQTNLVYANFILNMSFLFNFFHEKMKRRTQNVDMIEESSIGIEFTKLSIIVTKFEVHNSLALVPAKAWL